MDSPLDTYDDGYKLVKFVTGSENRMRLLSQIYQNGEVERDDIKDQDLMASSTLTKEEKKDG